ncbi:Helo-like-N domain-containing protein [Fusarium keratoplasticum]|uniref:Helo-like-N domain-containing protein n=1 Tax=Fusarium keratoplasticum TaxID=1328300 RepID=A0ACC0QEH0_9HYPO|nr:Helo-like-N domain-containing protein [Fusarium keratoplasticum]KAI8650483.1 Helo-like-N domain-containing protein [Fusarium keratoplasticum]
MDPLSITTGVLALLGVCYNVGTGLKKLYDDIEAVDETVAAIIEDVKALTKVLNTMKTSFDGVAGPLTGHVGAHWENIYSSLKDGNEALEGLYKVVQEVSRETSVLSGTRKQMRLKAAEGKIGLFRKQIQSFRDTLQLSMQALILWNQVSIQGANDRILPSLEDMQREIRNLAVRLNERISTLQTTPVAAIPQFDMTKPAEIAAMSNLRNCVRSAATIVSSASTILTLDRDEETETYCGSDWGDVLPSQTSESTMAWLQDSVDRGQIRIPGSSRPPQGDDSDSDSDLDLDLALGLYKKAQVKYQSTDYQGAEPLLRNCLSRLMPMTEQGRTRPRKSDLPSAHEVLSLFCQTCIGLEKWEDAATAMIDKIALSPHGLEGKDEAALKDISTLVMVLYAKKDYVQGHLYGRKLLRGYRKLGPSGEDGVERSLTLLVAICKASGNTDEEQAYSIMLENLRERKAAQSMPIPIIEEESYGWRDPAIPVPEAEEQATSPQTADGNALLPTLELPYRPSTPVAYSARASPEPPPPPSISAVPPQRSSIASSSSVQTTVQSPDSLTIAVPPIRPVTPVIRSEAEQLLLSSKYYFENHERLLRAPVKRKLVIVGDTLSGKSLLLHHQAHGNIDKVAHLQEAASLLETFYTTVTLADITVDMTMTDTPGQIDYDRLRPICYPNGNVIILTFDKSIPECFDNIEEAWMPEIQHFLPNTPIILVGNKKDLEHDPKIIQEAKKIGYHPVTYEEGAEKAAKLPGVVKFLETSAKTGEGIKEVFEFAALYALLGTGQEKPPSIFRRLFSKK